MSFHFGTGLCLEAKSLHEEALIAFFMSLSIDPDHVPSIVSIAEVMMKSGGDTLATAKSFLIDPDHVPSIVPK